MVKKIDERLKLKAEIVNGVCPTCEQDTILVGITQEYFRCMECGTDLQQYVNGKISYLPLITPPKNKVSRVKDWDDGQD